VLIVEVRGPYLMDLERLAQRCCVTPRGGHIAGPVAELDRLPKATDAVRCSDSPLLETEP